MYTAKDIIRLSFPTLTVAGGLLFPFLSNHDLPEALALVICGLIAPFIQFFVTLVSTSKDKGFIVMIGDLLIFFIAMFLMHNIFEFYEILGYQYISYKDPEGSSIMLILATIAGTCVLLLTFLPELINNRLKKVNAFRS